MAKQSMASSPVAFSALSMGCSALSSLERTPVPSVLPDSQVTFAPGSNLLTVLGDDF